MEEDQRLQAGIEGKEIRVMPSLERSREGLCAGYGSTMGFSRGLQREA